MSTGAVAVGGLDRDAVDALRGSLVDLGWMAGSIDDESTLQMAVYLDRSHPPGPIETGDPGRWIEEMTRDVVAAMRFLRTARARVDTDRGVIVLVTSMAGAVGVPDRTLDSAVSAGLMGLARSLAVETPAISVACVNVTLPGPPQPWASADIEWPHPGGPGLGDARTLLALAQEVDALQDAIGGAGVFVTLSVEPHS